MKLLYVFLIILVVFAFVFTGKMYINNYTVNSALSQFNKIAENEFNLKMKTEKELLNREIGHRYKDELSSFNQTFKQVELEKKQNKELEKKVKEVEDRLSKEGKKAKSKREK